MKRKLLRKRVQQVLKDANILDVGTDVFCRKSTPHDDGELPYINIYANTEGAERFDEAPKRYLRSYQVVCEIVTTHDTDEDLADELDDISGLVESAIENDAILQGFEPYDDNKNCVEDTEVINVQYDTEGNGSSPGGSCRVTFMITYIDQPITKLITDDFKEVDTKWEIGDHGVNQAEDKVVLEQE